MEHYISFVHNMKKLTALLLLISISTITYCSIIPPVIDTSLVISKIRELVPTDETFDVNVRFLESITFLNDSIAYYNPHGTLHVFEIKLDSIPKVKKLSRSVYHGHNFSRYNFIYDSALYSIGGTGLFGQCTKLTQFDFEGREWFEVEVKDCPVDVELILSSWMYKDTLNCLLIKRSINEPPNSVYRDVVFAKVDLVNNQYYNAGIAKHINPTILALNSPFHLVFESERYQVIALGGPDKNSNYRIFDKKNWNYFRSKFLNRRSRINGLSYCYVNDNKLFYRDNNGLVDSAIITSDSKINEYNSSHLFEPPNNKSNTGVKFAIYIFLFLIIIGLGMFFIRTRIVKKGNVNDEGKEFRNSIKEIIEIEGNLIQLKSLLITRGDLDSALRIGHLSSDTMKANRSVLLKRINTRGRVNVEGRRSPADKRNFEYYIS